MMGKHQTGSKTQGIWAYGRYDDQPEILDENENLLLQEIRKYFMIRWSRHYKKFDEHNLMNRIQYMILRAIKNGVIDDALNLAYFVPAKMMCSNWPIPSMYLEAHLQEVARNLQEKMTQPGSYRAAEHKSRVREMIDKRRVAMGLVAP